MMNDMKDYIEEKKSILLKYCENEGISFEKVMKSPKSYSSEFMSIQHREKNSNGLGLRDTKPSEILLVIRKTNDGITFEPHENMKKYLS